MGVHFSHADLQLANSLFYAPDPTLLKVRSARRPSRKNQRQEQPAQNEKHDVHITAPIVNLPFPTGYPNLVNAHFKKTSAVAKSQPAGALYESFTNIGWQFRELIV